MAESLREMFTATRVWDAGRMHAGAPATTRLGAVDILRRGLLSDGDQTRFNHGPNTFHCGGGQGASQRGHPRKTRRTA